MRQFLPLVVVLTLSTLLQGQTPPDEKLRNDIEPLVRAHCGDVGLVIRNLKSGVHYEYNPTTVMPTASLIKLPVMIATYRQADAGDIDLSKMIRLQAQDKVPGSGILTSDFSDNISLPLQDYIRLMIRYSDNTATNVVVEQIGLHDTARTMESLGLKQTKLHSKLYQSGTSIFPERSSQFGIGSTTASEMVDLLERFESGDIASQASTKAMREHLLSCDDRSKIATHLPSEIRFAHKTGAIANCRTDAGILYTTDGPIAICFLTNKNEDQSWSDDNEAHVLAGKIGQAIVDRFGRPDVDTRLREGAFGKIVEALQRTLNHRLKPSPNLAIDGDFGPATRGAVERFQRSNKLDETGIVTDATWSALGTLIEQDESVPAPDIVNDATLPVKPQAAYGDPPIVTAKAWAIADAKSGKIAFDFNSNVELEAASTTKIMTAYVVICYSEQHPEILDETVCFSTRADNTVGSTSGLRAGEEVTVRNLLYGLMLPSGNDASVALAEHFGTRIANVDVVKDDAATSYQHFVDVMNSTAEKLGMRQTHYVNTHGLSHEKHLISASDLIRLTHSVMQNSLFRRITSTRQFGCEVKGQGGYRRNVLWRNTNKLLEIEGFTGVKTGTTSAAGACLVATGERDGDELIAVVLGSSSSPARYADIRNLFRWAWQKRTVGSDE